MRQQGGQNSILQSEAIKQFVAWHVCLAKLLDMHTDTLHGMHPCTLEKCSLLFAQPLLERDEHMFCDPDSITLYHSSVVMRYVYIFQTLWHTVQSVYNDSKHSVPCQAAMGWYHQLLVQNFILMLNPGLAVTQSSHVQSHIMI